MAGVFQHGGPVTPEFIRNQLYGDTDRVHFNHTEGARRPDSPLMVERQNWGRVFVLRCRHILVRFVPASFAYAVPVITVH